MAEEKKVKYICLTREFSFSLVAIETLGAIGPKSLALLKDLGRKIKLHTGEEKMTILAQQLTVAVQRRNALAVMGAAAGGSSSQDNQFLN